jgi:hypothetical protein
VLRKFLIPAKRGICLFVTIAAAETGLMIADIERHRQAKREP